MPVKKKARAKSAKVPTVTFTRGARLSEPTDEPDLFTEFTEITDPKKRAFLAAYMTTPRVGKACKMAGISAKTAWNWRHASDDPLFLEAFQVAHQLAIQRAESELWRRGIDGYEKPVYHQGELRGSEKVFDTTAAIFMLKGAMPEKYADQRRYAAPGGGPIQMDQRIAVADLTDEQFMARLERAREQAQALLGAPVGGDLQGQVARSAPSEDSLQAAYMKRLAERNGNHGNNGNNGNE